jgi:hypothetical protein
MTSGTSAIRRSNTFSVSSTCRSSDTQTYIVMPKPSFCSSNCAL